MYPAKKQPIEIGRVKDEYLTYVVQVIPPLDDTAENGLPPQVSIVGEHGSNDGVIKIPNLYHRPIEPQVATLLARYLAEAADMCLERWPAWAKKLIAKSNPQHV